MAKTSLPKTSNKPRATKKRAPKDLAAQYGEKASSASAPKAVPVKTRRKRRTPEQKEQLLSMMAPDEGVLRRLAEAGAIASSQAPEIKAKRAKSNTSVKKKLSSRHWEKQCGKCGLVEFYTGAVALCAECGAILVRE